MNRILRTSACSVTLALVGVATAQTAAVNPQRPSRTVETVRPLDRVKRDAAKLDALLERGLKRHQQTPQPIADDATFVRRAHLQIAGRIPTLRETEEFLADQTPDKRHLLVDRLLNSPAARATSPTSGSTCCESKRDSAR